jgi:hypothetical protein
MPTRRRSDPTPDLFAALPTAKPPELPAAPVLEAEPAARPRHLLPKDLAGALERLGDAEVDSLLAAVTAEARRRGRPTPTSPTGRPKAEARSEPRSAAPADGGAGSLTTGKLNAVRAPFKAGVKPSAIARQFGISQSDVRRALADEGRKGAR